MINVVNKGKEGEREVVRLLREVIEQCIASEPSWDPETIRLLRDAPQRNQNQSAVGGCDINLLGIAFEVKRQQVVSIPAWWRQCTASAVCVSLLPVLLYRQNNKAWNVVMRADIPFGSTGALTAVARIDLDTFKAWFHQWVKDRVRRGLLT